jgi:hypothetical protein
LKLTEEEKEIF